MMHQHDYIMVRLREQRRKWRKSHPHLFIAKPHLNLEGVVNLLKWKCSIPGPQDSAWQGSRLNFTLEFSKQYPTQPPVVRFYPIPPHPNVFENGVLCLSSFGKNWEPSFTIKQMTLNVYNLFAGIPNMSDPANKRMSWICDKEPRRYQQLVEIYKKNNKFSL